MENKIVHCSISINSIFNLLLPISFTVIVIYYMVIENSIEVIPLSILIVLILILYGVLLDIKNAFFFEEFIKINYFFKLKKKHKYVYYNDIELVEYFHIAITYATPSINIILKNSNSKKTRILISIDSKKQRKAILQLLYDKNIKIKIKSEFKEDDNIINFN